MRADSVAGDVLVRRQNPKLPKGGLSGEFGVTNTKTWEIWAYGDIVVLSNRVVAREPGGGERSEGDPQVWSCRCCVTPW